MLLPFAMLIAANEDVKRFTLDIEDLGDEAKRTLRFIATCTRGLLDSEDLDANSSAVLRRLRYSAGPALRTR